MKFITYCKAKLQGGKCSPINSPYLIVITQFPCFLCLCKRNSKLFETTKQNPSPRAKRKKYARNESAWFNNG